MKKQLIAALLSLAILGLAGGQTVKADVQKSRVQYPAVVAKLAERFDLNKDEVKAVFDEVKSERRQQMQARFEEKLNQAVENGRINEKQKQAILTKKKQMQGWRQNLEALSQTERREEIERRRMEMKSWAEEQGLDLKGILSFGRGRLRRANERIWH